MEVFSDLNAEGDAKLRSRTSADQLGRVILTEASEDGSTYTIKSDTAYEQMGRVTYSSNPHRSGPASTGAVMQSVPLSRKPSIIALGM